MLCDIGNSSASFLDNTKYFSMPLSEFMHYKTNAKVHYISVNDRLKDFLKTRSNFINIEPYFKFDTIYQGLGIDRIAACYTINDGVIIDAGSAITVDVMAAGLHLGGFILPGIANYRKIFAEISPRLKCELNTQISLDAFAQKTSDALSYGVFKSIVLLIKDTAKKENLYFTGGDGQFLAKFFEANAIFDKLLIFRGMQKVLRENPKLL